ncbi:uncharacterized protein RJT21DRAFT_114804 [Scheffersomyces amazonensis]|uniref:uncharacterized protein n=1 Tax=Scheffersomyces amazonensis TaxID=1078765 RepID=UPI00315D5513
MNNSSSVFKVGSSSSTGPTNTGSSSSIPSGSLVDEETMRKRMNQNSNIPIHDVSGSQTNPIFNIPEITNQTTNQYVSNWTSVSQQQFQLQQQPQQLQQQQQQVLIQQQDISQPQTQIQHESDTQRAPQEYQQGANTQSNQGRIFFNQSEYQVPQSMNYSTGLETFQQSASNQSKVEESVQRKQNDQTQ